MQVPGASEPVGKETVGLFRTLHYERKEPGVWVSSGRPIPDWVKVTEGEKIKLSDGKVVWIERRLPIIANSKGLIANSKAIGLNIRGEWTSSGSRPAFDQIHRLAAEGLQELREKYNPIVIYFFGDPQKEGFHIRRQVTAFIFPRQPDDYWLVEKFQLQAFTDGRALVIWYVPSKPFVAFNPELLDMSDISSGASRETDSRKGRAR